MISFQTRFQGPYSQHFIFFLIYEWVPFAWVFFTTKPFRSSKIEHISLLDQFIGYEENVVL